MKIERDPRFPPGWLAEEVRKAADEVMKIRGVPLETRRALRDAGRSFLSALGGQRP